MTEKTLGEIFDDAFSEKVLHGKIRHFEDLSVDVRAGIEAGAQSVIEAHEARKWQPIETAPRDTYILCLRRDGTCDILRMRRRWEDQHGIEQYGLRPTHWQTLPAPPKEL